MYAAVCVLRGKVYEALENRQRAIKWYRAALKSDPFCYESYEALINNHMLTNDEEQALISSIDVRPEDRWLMLLYSTMCKKYENHEQLDVNLRILEGVERGSPSPQPLQPSSKHNDQRSDELGGAAAGGDSGSRSKGAKPAQHTSSDGSQPASQNEDEDMERTERRESSREGACLSLAKDLSVVTARAEYLFCRGDTLAAYKICCGAVQWEPRAMECMTVYLACMVELGKKNELFKVAHRLVQDYSEQALSWYAVGCYYLSTGQYDAARRFFGKATQLQAHHAPSWIAYGHAFAAQDESDQALAAYRTAARLFPGLHQPVLGMGREYQHMNNHTLAEQMYLQAYAICNLDPLICNELGVLYYQKKDYDTAAAWLRRALDLLMLDKVSATWQPTILNLGHTFRKQGNYQQAVDMYNEALGLCPYDAGTFSALGFTYHLMGKLTQAIETYHKALGFKADDNMTQDLLKDALQMHCAHCCQHDDPGLM